MLNYSKLVNLILWKICILEKELKNKILYILMFFVFNFSSIFSEVNSYSKSSSYEGLYFLVGFMENEATEAEPYKDLDLRIFIGSAYDTKVTITFSLGEKKEVFLDKNTVHTVSVPSYHESKKSEKIERNLVEIVSEFPITVYAYSTIFRSSDSYACIPLENWGKEYSVISMPNDQYNPVKYDSVNRVIPRSSEFMVMAGYDSTEVTIIPRAFTKGLKQEGSVYKVTLNKGDCYLVQSYPYPRGSADLTGSIVRADKPVGVLSGHVRTALLQGFQTEPPDTKDHICEMLMPTNAWGMSFISVPFGTSPNKGDFFKATSLDTNAILSINTKGNVHNLKFNNISKSAQFVGLNEPAYWVASHRVQLAQFMLRTDDTLENIYYDPAMVILPPIEQFVSNVTFVSPGNQFKDLDKYNGHFVTIVADKTSLNTLKMNNELVYGISKINDNNIYGTNFYYATMPTKEGVNIIECEEGRFSGVIFGRGHYDSYAMILGSSLYNPFQSDSLLPFITVDETCSKLKGEISDIINDKSYGIHYAWVDEVQTKNFKWNIEPVSPDATSIKFTAEPIDYALNGKFVIDYKDKGGNSGRYEYNHNSIKFGFNNQIDFGDVNWKDSICYTYIVKNEGNADINFNSANISNDNRIKIYTNKTLPFLFKSGEEIEITICLKPEMNVTPVVNILNLVFDCGFEYKVKVIANILGLEIATQGIDFGNVRIGESKCDSIIFSNKSAVEITLTSLTSIFKDNYFTFDTVGIFPVTISPNSDFKLKVCFYPIDRKDYSNDITFYNQYNLKNNIIVKGSGIGPLITADDLDYGEIRVGSSKTLKLRFLNSGNDNGLVKFKEFKLKKFDDTLTNNIIKLNNLLVKENDFNEVELTFTPVDTDFYEVIAIFETDLLAHAPIEVRFTGKGIIPIITTTNYDFGDTEIYTTKSDLITIFSSVGSEKLTVDKLFIQSGDINQFTLKVDTVINKTIDIGSDYLLHITYNPNVIGNHKIEIGIINDATANFNRDTAYITISGKSISPSKSGIEITLENKPFFSCRSDEVDLFIENKSSKAVDLTDLKLTVIPEIITARILNFKPYILEPNEKISYKIEIYAERNNSAKIRVDAEFFSSFWESKEFDIIPQSLTININSMQDMNFNANDTVKVVFKGVLGSSTDSLVNFKLETNITKETMYVIENNTKLTISNNGQYYDYDAKVEQTSDKILISIPDEIINTKQGTIFETSFTAIALLDEKMENIWKVKVNSDTCFNPQEIEFKTILNDVCIFPLRHIQYFEQNSISIIENPVNNNLSIKVDFYADNIVNFSIFDIQGNEIILESNLYLKKGKYFLNYILENVPNGIYILKTETKNFINNSLFVITK